MARLARLQPHARAPGPGLLPAATTGLGAVGLGIATALLPLVALAAGIALLILAYLLRASRASLAGYLLATLAVTAAVAAQSSGSPLTTVIGGPARIVAIYAAVAIYLSIVSRTSVRVPSLLTATLVLTLVTLILEAAVRLQSPAGAVVTSQLLRDLLTPFACVVGLISTASVADRVQPYRTLAAVTVAVYLGSIAYYAWTSFGVSLPVLTSLFAATHHASVYGARAVFPFSQDSPNGCALAFVLLAALSVPPLLASSAHADRVRARLVVALLIPAVLSTQSRTGLLSLGAAAECFLVLKAPREWRVYAALASVLAIAGALLVSSSILPTQRQFALNAPTLTARKSLWSQALSQFQSAPVLGHGYRYSSSQAFPSPPQTADRPAYALAPPPVSIAGTQSEYLGQLVDGGVLGVVAFGAGCALLLAACRRLLRTDPQAPEALGYLVALAASAVAAIDTQLTSSSIVLALIWMGLGLVCGRLATSDAPPPAPHAGSRSDTALLLA